MSEEGNSRQKSIPRGLFVLSKEEAELKRNIEGAFFMFNFLPLWLVSTGSLRYFIQKGKIKPQRPGLYYLGVGLSTYIFSKVLAFNEVKRQMIEKFPDGIFAQTRNMTKDQLMEYLNKKELDLAKAKLEAAGMGVIEKPDQALGSNTSYKSPQDIRGGQHDLSEGQTSKRTYADLRKQAAGGPPLTHNTSPKPINTSPDKEFIDDPPSKLKTGKKNRYGDDME